MNGMRWAILFCILATGARAGEAEAIAISSNIQARHLPFGAVLDPVFTTSSSDQIATYTHCGDSAIWTGHYLAAEAFRYKVTRSSDALANVTKAVGGIKALTDITGTELLARCMFPASSPYAAGMQAEESHNGIYTGRQAGIQWVGNTSRDQYLGVLFGLAVAYDMMDAGPLKDSIAQLATRQIDFLLSHSWTVAMPDGAISTSFLLRADQMLGILQIGRHLNPSRFSSKYDVQSIALAFAVLPPVALEVLNDDSYYKFNLDYINFYNLLRLESGIRKSGYQLAYDVVRNHTASHQNAFFDVVDRALNGPNTARDAEIVSLLNAWLLRPRRDVFVDLNGKVPVCGGQACTPVPVALRPPSDYIWQRTPFLLSAGGAGTVETAGIDYILPYWMARYYGVIGSSTVQSAAAPSAAIAPDSIASIFGTNLTTQTLQASAPPYPTTLGGVTVNVQGIPAALTYVSPGQINFIVPPGTTAGTATIAVGSQTFTATIQPVAPALFSMNGNGAGIAAATAFRIRPPNPQPQFPVDVFQCDANGRCTATPIDVGLDMPVYLTFYGTGIRNRTALSKVTVTINGTSVPVLYAGPQPQYPGLDQVNVSLVLSLRGSGESNVVLTVDGQTANTVTINIQ
jgi:uncharacterized protein (TIGR03437 family)